MPDLVANDVAAYDLKQIDLDLNGNASIFEFPSPGNANGRMIRSAEINEFSAALADAQADMEDPKKNRTARIQMKKGGIYEYQYVSFSDYIAIARPALGKRGISLMQTPLIGSSAIGIWTVMTHCSGQFMAAYLSLPLSHSEDEDVDERVIAKKLTYARKFALTGMLALAGDDLPMHNGEPYHDGGRGEEKRKPRRAQLKQIAALKETILRVGIDQNRVEKYMQSRWPDDYSGAKGSELQTIDMILARHLVEIETLLPFFLAKTLREKGIENNLAEAKAEAIVNFRWDGETGTLPAIIDSMKKAASTNREAAHRKDNATDKRAAKRADQLTANYKALEQIAGQEGENNA